MRKMKQTNKQLSLLEFHCFSVYLGVAVNHVCHHMNQYVAITRISTINSEFGIDSSNKIRHCHSQTSLIEKLLSRG
jgi:hypothetical protein